MWKVVYSHDDGAKLMYSSEMKLFPALDKLRNYDEAICIMSQGGLFGRYMIDRESLVFKVYTFFK